MEHSEQWESIIVRLKAKAHSMHVAREAGLSLCRQITQTASKSIRHVHRRQFDEAQNLLETTIEISANARAAMAEYGELVYGGYLHDAEKEMVEAAGVLAIVRSKPLPDPDALGVGLATYLNGMAEAASEVRRFALDEMRNGDLVASEAIMKSMESIYDDLITFDFPDTMTGGLRRTCDALRAVIERTRSDLTTASGQYQLIEALQKTRDQFSS